MITSHTLGAILACVPSGTPRLRACEHVVTAVEVAAIHVAPEIVPLGRGVPMTALRAIDLLEDRASDRFRGFDRVPLRGTQALLRLRAMVARGRPIIRTAGATYLADDEAGDELRSWPVGPLTIANVNHHRQEALP